MAYTGIDKSTNYFNTVLYAGNNTADTNITGVGFQPDFVWLKNTDNGTGSHAVFDAARGVSKRIKPDDSAAEATASGVSAFDSDGFTLGTSWNQASTNFVSWNWKLGTTSGITTNGSTTITPTAYSFNATSGMSAIQCTGTGAAGLFPHGLGVAPKIVISKRLNDTNSWFVQTDLISSWTASNYLVLNTTAAVGSNTGIIDATDATNVSLYGSDDWVNKSGDTYIHYCFAEKTGFSKFGTYTGNGNADGPFIYCGFKPAWVMVKNTEFTNDWNLLDDKRDTHPNPQKLSLFPNTTGVEAGDYLIDFNQQGFKIRTATGGLNASGEKLFYMAFASAPLVGSNNVPATAR